MPFESFTELLEGLPTTEFLDRHWERSPLHIAGSPRRYEQLMTLADLDQLVLQAPAIGEDRGAYCIRAGGSTGQSAEQALNEYPIQDSVGRPSISKVHQAIDQGYTVVVNYLARVSAPIAGVCALVEESLQHAVGCNLYFTPAAAQGFGSHRDFHDTFFLQIDGAKTWSIWAPSEELPISGEAAADRALLGDPDLMIELEAGDLLYLPRGWIHAGETTDDHSLHLTLGVRTLKWTDVVAELLDALSKTTPELRASVPLAHMDRDVSANLCDLLSALNTKIGADPEYGKHAIEATLQRRLKTHPAAVKDQLSSTLRRDEVTLDTRVSRAPGLWPLVTVRSDCARITFSGSYVDGPAQATDAFHFVLARSAFRVGELPGLPASAQVDLVRELVLQGLLSIDGTST